MFTSQVEPLLVRMVQVDCVGCVLASYSVEQVSTSSVAESTICELRVLQVLVQAGSAGFLESLKGSQSGKKPYGSPR